jgi:tripeptidyl-peptidase-1
VFLYPSWPASSPWVTAVGATKLNPAHNFNSNPNSNSNLNSNSNFNTNSPTTGGSTAGATDDSTAGATDDSTAGATDDSTAGATDDSTAGATGGSTAGAERASTLFGSGGGFSRSMFAPFAAQLSDVQQYLKHAPQLPPSTLFNASGRATPDVAALGEGFQVLINGEVKTVGGTSASAPLFAGLVSLLNEARLQKDMPAMGFLNPWLYAHADALTDIVEGTNAIGRGGSPSPYGFNCTDGFDPVTGLGTPNFMKMLAAALSP